MEYYRFPKLSFTMVHNGSNSAPVLTVTQKDLFSHYPLGPISHIQVTIEYKKYSVFILLHLWRTGEVKDIEDVMCSFLMQYMVVGYFLFHYLLLALLVAVLMWSSHVRCSPIVTPRYFADVACFICCP